MFRPIRKKNREISPEDAKLLLADARRGVLAVNGDDGYPYAIPVNFFYDEKKQRICFHGSRAGHKIDALNRCDKVCFTVFGHETVKDEPWAPYVRSVVVFGRCHVIGEAAEAAECLRQFAMKYYPDEKTVNEEIALDGKAVRMYEIVIEHMSGKEIQER